MVAQMNEKTYLLISATIFLLITIFHLLRLVTLWSIQIGTTTFPIWGSWLALIVGAVLSIWALLLITQKNHGSHWKGSH